jgi:hypothetical protein
MQAEHRTRLIYLLSALEPGRISDTSKTEHDNTAKTELWSAMG